MSNIIELDAFRRKQSEDAPVETFERTVQSFKRLNPPDANIMIMNVQHQLDYMHHNALVSFQELAVDGDIYFIRLLDIARAVFRNVYFPITEIANAICRNIHHRDEETGKELKDPSVKVNFVNIHTAHNSINKADSGGIEPELVVELRLISLYDNTPPSNSNISFNEIDRSGIEKLTFQTDAILKNVLEISANCGGDTRLVDGGNLFAARIPFSDMKEILLVVKPSNALKYCDHN